MEPSCSARSRANKNSSPVKLPLTFPATLPCPAPLCPTLPSHSCTATHPATRALTGLELVCVTDYLTHPGKAEKQNSFPWMRGIYLSLASLSDFHKAPKNFVVLRPESLNEIETGSTWGEAERENLAGLHKLCFFWKSRPQHNNICSCFHLC